MLSAPTNVHDTQGMADFIKRLKYIAETGNDLTVQQAAFFLEMYWNVLNTHNVNSENPNPNLDNLLVGREAKAKHPITVLNPTETFKIVDAHIDFNKIYVCGEKTMWFELGSIELVDNVVATTLTQYEVKVLEDSPVAMQELMDYHDNQAAQADAMGVDECVVYSDKRRNEFLKRRNDQLIKRGYMPLDIGIDYREPTT
jgi:hypothetical protein